MAETTGSDIWREFSYQSQDDLTLRGRIYGNLRGPRTPLICLPGLTRSTRDFDAIARIISEDKRAPRAVLSFDYRGRGRSEYDTNWKNYNPAIEAQDVLNGIVAAGLEDVAILGTSRGGLIAMLLGSMRPSILSGVVLHDIGPEIDLTGLLKIKNYVNTMPPPTSWETAADILKTIHQGSFPNYTSEDWDRAARLTFANKDGKPVVDFDPRLAKTLEGITPDNVLPDLWPQFRSLRGKPLLVIRGGISDLLSAKALERMDDEHPTMRSVTVDSEGHVPSLTTPDVIKEIHLLLARADKKHS